MRIHGHDPCSAWQHWGLTALAGILVLGLLAATATAKKPPKPPPEPPDPAIVYIDAHPTWDIMAMNEDGSNVFPILDSATQPYGKVSWSPDATQLVFNASKDGGPGIFIVNVDGTGQRRVTSTATVYTSQPGWSPVPCPDGEHKIAFADEDENGKRDIYIVNLDGTGRMNLTNTADLTEHTPTWDPSGTRLAFAGRSGQIWILYLGLDEYDQLTVVDEWHVTETTGPPLSTGSKGHIQWAKTEDKIAVASRLEGNINYYELFVIDLLDPANPIRVTDTPKVSERDPSWSSDDTEIVFEQEFRAGKQARGIYAIRPDGTGLRLILKGEVGNPDWRR